MQRKTTVFAFLIFLLLFITLEWSYKYHFFYIEQNQLFLFTKHYFYSFLSLPGGLANYIAEFMVQFYAVPYLGSLINAGLLTAVSVLTAVICRKIPVHNPLYLLYSLPAISLLCIQFNYNYNYHGTIAFLLLQLFFIFYIHIRTFNSRLIFGLLSLPLLFWWAGSVAILYALCILIWEVINKSAKWYLALILLLEALALAYSSLYFSVLGESRFAFTPELYFHSRLVPGKEIYYAWISLPVVLLAAKLVAKYRAWNVKSEVFLTSLQSLLILVIAWIAMEQYLDQKSYRLKQMDYYARNGQWESILHCSEGAMENFLELNYLNLALAEKDILADNLFKYDQRGVNGLFIPWSRTLQPSLLLSDIHFCIGNSAISQEMAFESYLCTAGYGNPRSLKRLIQLNLIYGEYPVAEKYLDILESTLFYRNWAGQHRHFLNNDPLIEADALLGEKRKSLVSDNYISNPLSVGNDLVAIASQYPQNKTAISYLGCMLLLSKDLNTFRTVLETYYGTDVLPSLPYSFQEAAISLYEHDPEMWKHYNLSQEVIARFAGYKGQVLANQQRRNLPVLLKQAYGDTFWYFFMYK